MQFAGSPQESLVLEKIGAESHLSEFRSLKDSSRTAYVKKLKNRNSKLKAKDFLEDNLLSILDKPTTPTYTGSRELDYILEEAYTNNEPIDSVIKRHSKAAKAKNGK